MAGSLYGWLQSVACYCILLGAVMNFLPDNSYKKYIQYYMGLLLILLMLAPVFRITGIQKEMDAYLSGPEEDGGREEWRQKAQAWEKDWEEYTTILEGEEVVP